MTRVEEFEACTIKMSDLSATQGLRDIVASFAAFMSATVQNEKKRGSGCLRARTLFPLVAEEEAIPKTVGTKKHTF